MLLAASETRTRSLMICSALAVLMTTLSSSTAVAEHTLTTGAIAVLDFEIPSHREAGSVWADLLMARLSGKVPVVDRTQLRKILEELRLSNSGFFAPETALPLGKFVGAKTLLGVGVFEIGETTIVALRAIETESGRINGKTLKFRREVEPEQAIDRIAETVIASLRSWQVPTEVGLTPARESVDLSGPLVAVLNFDALDTADEEWSWLSQGLCDLTINLLASQKIRVISRDNMLAQLRELEVTRPKDDLTKAIKVLKARRAVHGMFQVDKGRVQIRMVLLNPENEKPLHTVTVEGAVENVFALHRGAVAEVVDVLENRRAGTLDVKRLPVWNDQLHVGRTLYRGVALYDKGQYFDAWLLFRQAQQAAPSYPDAAYWAGRMMYYVEEYHQARYDLLQFLTTWADHPHAGDAGLEIIHTSQSVGNSEAEVLSTLALVASLAPNAEVANFERLGQPTLLGYYTDALASQIHISHRQFRLAAEALGRHLNIVSRASLLYVYAWDRMFDLRNRHFNATGEWFELPQPPLYTEVDQSSRGVSVSSKAPEFYSYSRKGDFRSERPFINLSADEPRHTFDLHEHPLVIGESEKTMASVAASSNTTFTHYLRAPPGYSLGELTIDVEAEEVNPRFESITLWYERDLTNYSLVIENHDPNHTRHVVRPVPGSRIIGLWPQISARPRPGLPLKSRGRCVAWKVEAKLVRIEEKPSTLIVRVPADSRLNVVLHDPPHETSLSGFLPNFPSGTHRLVSCTQEVDAGKSSLPTQDVNLKQGDVANLTLDTVQQRIPNASGVQMQCDDSIDLHTFTEMHRVGIGQAGDDRTSDQTHIALCDDQQGRLIAVWSVQRDLYLAISLDHGRTWSPCRQLPVPVNTAHHERQPCLMQDRKGRFILAFLSDRGLDRNASPYVCWSDNLKEFSAPVRVSSAGGAPQRIWQRQDGTYLLYSRAIGSWKQLRTVMWQESAWGVFQSQDLLQWTKPQALPAFDQVFDVIADDADLVAVDYKQGQHLKTSPTGSIHILQTYFRVWTSLDGINFQLRDTINIQEVPRPEVPRDPNCFLISTLNARKIDDEIYLFAGGNEGKFFHREKSGRWNEVLYLNRGLGQYDPRTLWLLGEAGFLRFAEGPPQWIITNADRAPIQNRYALVPQLTATSFRVNLRTPEPDPQGTKMTSADYLSAPGAIKVVTHRAQDN